ncbi:cbb3-type cytochrome c oxidase subunit I [Chloroflexota bacterium]
MPKLSVWFVRAAFLYLVLGLFFGALILAQKGIPFYAPVWYLFPLHMEFLLVGWLIQLAMGVAFWVIPRFGSGSPRGPVKLVWGAFALLNAGILITILQYWFPAAVWIGRVAEGCAGILFVIGSWRRIKPLG